MRLTLKGLFLKGRLWVDNRGFGMNEVLGIAAALIIAGLVIIPGIKELADDMMDGLTLWWDDIADVVFSKI